MFSLADKISTIDRLFSPQANPGDLVLACYLTQSNVTHTRELYRDRGGLEAIENIIAPLRSQLEQWFSTLELKTPEAIKGLRKSLELGGFWATSCFWKQPEWSDDQFSHRLRTLALWICALWLVESLLESTVSVEIITEVHKSGWMSSTFDPVQNFPPNVIETLWAMHDCLRTVREMLDKYDWSHKYHTQLERTVIEYLDSQQPPTEFTSVDHFVEHRCRSSGTIPTLVLMAVLKLDPSEAGEAANRNQPAETTIEFPTELFTLCAIQITSSSDILDYEYDCSLGCFNLVRTMQELSAKSKREAIVEAISFHRQATHNLLQAVRENPSGELECLVAQVAYGVYVMEALYPRHKDASQVATDLEKYPAVNRRGKRRKVD
eukprot:c45829_g1_i1.p1 GENE.c45829_g1_i1~~c45829_g1_i1.p1  ORF type:complete len:378 (+),score=59.64 c45829_g1_i1:144-1277(+)